MNYILKGYCFNFYINMSKTNRFKVITVWIVCNSYNEVLLWKRAETEDVFPWCRAIPWGKVELDWDENTRDILEQSVVREIKEEIWIEVKNCRYISSHYGFNWWEFKLYIAYKADHMSWTPQALDETEEVKFFTIKDALQLKLAPNVDIILQQLWERL